MNRPGRSLDSFFRSAVGLLKPYGWSPTEQTRTLSKSGLFGILIIHLQLAAHTDVSEFFVNLFVDFPLDDRPIILNPGRFTRLPHPADGRHGWLIDGVDLDVFFEQIIQGDAFFNRWDTKENRDLAWAAAKAVSMGDHDFV
jgi:hypothetical protein